MHLSVFIASLARVGFYSAMPGTMGSLVALIILLVLHEITWFYILVIAVALISVPICDSAARYLQSTDPSAIVLDELVGCWITFASFRLSEDNWLYFIVGFVLFRFFDIVKPFPIDHLQSLPGGFGIVIDDVVAGIFSNIILQCIRWLKIF